MILQALFAQATQCHRQGDLDEAARLYAQILVQDPSDVAVLNNLGGILYAGGEFDRALVLQDRAAGIAPDNCDLLMNRIHTLMALGRSAEALASCDIIVAQRPDHVPAWTTRGRLLQALGRIAEATGSFGRALALEPSNCEVLNNLGILHCELNDHQRALAYLDEALGHAPDSWPAHNNRGLALRGLGQLDEAIASFSRAQILNPGYAEAFYNQGDLFLGLRRYEEALRAYDRAATLAPGLRHVQSNQFYARMQLCDWTGFDSACETLFASVDRGEAVSPFLLLLLPSSPAQQRKAAQLYSAWRCAGITPAPRPAWRHDRIRIAYVSATFRNHPVMQLVGDLFGRHDRTRFETFAFSLGPSDESAVRRRIEGAFEHFLDLHDRDDLAIAGMIRDHQIDIAVDLDGFTEGARMGVLAGRPAAIQVQWLGYAGTMGAAHIDYIIADNCVAPAGAEAGFGERVARLPVCFQPNSPRPDVRLSMPRTEAGLPAKGFVFCCFNNLCKITPDVFAVWMRLLAALPGSVLWLRSDNGAAERNITGQAGRHGIARDRIVFAPRVDEEAHYARMMAADLFIDTFHYNAHTTASDALWAGLPVVTRMGQTFAGRVASSLLQAAGLPELITHSSEEYEQLILKLAGAPQRLAQIRAKLMESRGNSPLFDIGRFTVDFEALMVELVESRSRGDLAG